MTMRTNCKTLLRRRQQQQVAMLFVLKCLFLLLLYNRNNGGNMVESFTINNTIQQQQQSKYMIRPTTTTTTTNGTTRLHATNNFLENIFSSFTGSVMTKKEITPPKPKYETVVIEPDYRVAALFLTLGIVLDTIPYIQFTLGPFITLLGILFLVQTFRIRFVFNEQNQFELKTITPFFMKDNNNNDDTKNDELQDSGENIIVGGANCWDCDTVVNYDFFPKALMDTKFFGQPILIYFKETQTPNDTWNEGPGKIANDPIKIQNGVAVPGQVHFFPAICNAQQIQQEFQKRNCKKL
jgi:hypothetical protein